MTNHTPGPWKIDGRKFLEHGMFHVSCGRYIVAQALGETRSCELEAEANARLIAAAPDLLKAIKTLEAALIRDMGAGYAGAALCQAVIAKVENGI